jgi:hypothetical protein
MVVLLCSWVYDVDVSIDVDFDISAWDFLFDYWNIKLGPEYVSIAQAYHTSSN